jgi:multiple sugar transport system ATP-binding protein
MASVELNHVSKTYKNGQDAVQDVSLEIHDGEFMVLVGPSGCGKSTTLRMVAGLESISAGSISICSRVVNEVEAKDRDVAMVFQSYALYPHMTVYDNLAFGLRRQHQPKADVERRVNDVAVALGLDQLLKRRPAELSGGQRQRVALGRAIVRDPQVFLMDEPLSNLDALLRVETRFEILKLHQRLGATFIYVTHDQVEAMTMGDRIAVMRGGLLQQVDAPGRLYERPANQFVAGFIGSPRMNFINVEVGEVGGEPRLLGNGVALPIARTQLARGTRFVAGLRPEHLLDARYAPSGTAAVTGRVEVVETLGSELHVHVLVGEQRLVSRMDPKSGDLKPEQEIQLAVSHEGLHLFDPETGEAA